MRSLNIYLQPNKLIELKIYNYNYPLKKINPIILIYLNSLIVYI